MAVARMPGLAAGMVSLVLTVAAADPPGASAASPEDSRAVDGSLAHDSAHPGFVNTQERWFAADRVLVAPAPGSAPEDLRQIHRSVGAQVERILPGTRVREVRLPAGLDVEQAVRTYQRSPAVAYAEPDFLVRTSSEQPNDPGFSALYGLHNTGQTGGTPDADIDAFEAWGVTKGTRNTLVAVVDTGVDINHPDLSENIWTNSGELPGNGVDDDDNGYVDDVHGWDFHNDDNTVYDGAWDDHGTHVAGTIGAAGGNGIGVTGVTWRTRLMPVKFLGPDGGYISDAIAALDYAVANGAVISNNSWGGGGYSQALKDAIEHAGSHGHLFVAAAGNGGADGTGDDNDTTPAFPASYTSTNLVAVAATDHAGKLAPFSNYGRASVDLAAPGVGVLSTLPANAYGRYSGTSMATPHVSGAAALLLSAEPALSHSRLKRRLLATVDHTKGLRASTASGGRLNLARALGLTFDPTVTLQRRPTTVRHGDATTLSGRLTLGDRTLAGQPVVVQQRPVGASGWTSLPEGTASTDAEGNFTLTDVRPTKKTDYRAWFAGSEPDRVNAATSPIRRTKVRIKVSLVTSSTTLELGRARRLSGAITPARRGTVRVLIARNGSVIKRQALTLANSRYRFGYQPPRPGRYTFRTMRKGDTDLLGARSPREAFRVSR